MEQSHDAEMCHWTQISHPVSTEWRTALEREHWDCPGGNVNGKGCSTGLHGGLEGSLRSVGTVLYVLYRYPLPPPIVWRHKWQHMIMTPASTCQLNLAFLRALFDSITAWPSICFPTAVFTLEQESAVKGIFTNSQQQLPPSVQHYTLPTFTPVHAKKYKNSPLKPAHKKPNQVISGQ